MIPIIPKDVSERPPTKQRTPPPSPENVRPKKSARPVSKKKSSEDPSKIESKRQASDSWCFTIFEVNEPIHPLRDWPKCVYAIWQLEPATTTERPHYQGYVQFSTRKELKSLKKVHGTAHWTPANGSDEQNYHYCTKPHEACDCEHCTDALPRLDGPWEEGTRQTRARGKSGARTDKLAVVELMKKPGTVFQDIVDNHPVTYMQYHRGIEKLWDLQQKPRRCTAEEPVIVYWIWGPSSTGKTTRANEIAALHPELGPMYNCATPKASGLRWNGYKYEKIVFIDDFTASYMRYEELLRMLDNGPWQCPTDGGSMQFQGRLIIIASILHPSLHYQKLYLKQNREWTELDRRITYLEHREIRFNQGFRSVEQQPRARAEDYFETPTYQKHLKETQHGVPQ